MSRVITKPPHREGRTVLAFSKDGARCLTGGVETLVRIWTLDSDHDPEPEIADEAEGGITCLGTFDDFWISGSEDTEVRRYAANSREILGIVTTVAGVPIRDVSIDCHGCSVAVASDELQVKVVEVENLGSVKTLTGYQASVRSVSWHPTEQILATVSADGKIIIWNLSPEEPKKEKVIDGVVSKLSDDQLSNKDSDPTTTKLSSSNYDCSILWHPSGDVFFVATKTHDIAVFQRSDWSKKKTLSSKEMTGPITALALSHNGKYIATAIQRKIYVFSTEQGTLVAEQKANVDFDVCQMVFSPRDNLIAWTDLGGSFTRWYNAIPSDLPDPVRKVTATTASREHNADVTDIFNMPDSDLQDAVNDDEDMDGIDQDFVIDDTGDYFTTGDKPVARNEGYKEMVSITKAQPPLQPGSTPMENRKRYLAFNPIGVMEATDQDTHQLITVEFFDRSTRSGYNFTDHFKYDIGCLGERGALFACPPEGEHVAHVLYKPYGSRDQDWTYKLRPGTTVLGIAAGGQPPKSSLRDALNTSEELQGYGNIVVATSENDLTFLSGTGRERRILGLGGDFVSMVAGAEWVFVVYRPGSTTIDGSQNLHYCLINFDDFSVRQRDVLPIPRGKVLKWIGLTSEGAPAIYDTSGRIHILTKFRMPHHGSWTRLLDTELLERKQGKDESYWPVGITGDVFMCLILKGRQEHPRFPRPLIQELPITFPFRIDDVPIERVQRNEMYLDLAMDSLDDEVVTPDIIEKERAMDKELIALMQGACRANNIGRALELAKLLHYKQALDTAAKLADFYHLSSLREQLLVLKDEKEDEEDFHVVMREKRRRWNKVQAPPRRLEVEEQSSSSSRSLAFQDFEPPVAVDRPGLQRATPIVQSSRMSMPPPSSNAESFWGDTSLESSPVKRKRDEAEDFEFATPSLPTPKQPKVNPFARKPAQESNNRNPFARKSDHLNKVVQKSESFFEKVDAAETGTQKTKRTMKGKEKDKDKKEGPRQTTLFGLPLGNSEDKKNSKVSSKKKGPSRSSESTAKDNEDAETPADTQETQVIDSQMDEGLPETQTSLDDDSQMEEETQLVDDSVVSVEMET